MLQGTNCWRYSGKEEQKAISSTLPLIDYGARMYDPAVARWMSVDPLAEKYYPMSPYGYCAGNPIVLVDPTGSDVWEIDNEGRIVNRIEDKTTDSFYMVSKAEDGTYQRTGQSISFEYGTVISQRSISFSPKQYDKSAEKAIDTYDVYKIRGDGQATQMFEFLSQNTSVEWSQAKTGIAGDKGLDFVTTSHIDNKEPGMTKLLEGQLFYGYTIRELNHSHPRSNKGLPSGLYDNKNGSKAGEWGDIGFARDVTNYLKAKRWNIPTFNVYAPASNSYSDFRPDSKKSDYEK